MKKILLYLYQFLIFLPILLPATIITALVVMIGCSIGDRRFWGCYPPRYWSKLACRVALCRINVQQKVKLDPERPYVFVANHQGAFDIFLMYGYLGQDIKWVQKHELRKIPFVGKASEVAGHVFVNQSNLASMKETIIQAEEQLSKGASMAIFPEGSRTHTGKMGRFKRGAFIIAKEMGLSVVPVTINGSFNVMKMHTYLIHPSKLELVIHEPIPTKDLSEDEIPNLMNKCREVVYSDLWEIYK